MQQVYVYDPYNAASNYPMQVMPPQAMRPPAPVQQAGQAGPVFAGIQYVTVVDPMTELNNCQSCIIRQQPEILEAIYGCETANRYHVLGNANGFFKYLFKCQERSGFCQRNFCPSNMREFNMDIYHAVTTVVTGTVSGKFASAYKPFKCPCFCLNRPEIIINLGAENKYVGKIKHLFTCCDPEFEIYNATGLKYYVRADCCQCGLLCANNFCGKMSTATFEIYSPGTSNILATISKIPAQSFSEMVTDADSYTVGFPQGATAEDKLLLIALGLMIDYQYFETDSSDQNQKSGYGRRHRYGYY